MSHTTLLTIPKLIEQVLALYEVDSAKVFEQSDIELNPQSASLARVPVSKMTHLWQLAVEETGNKELGLIAAQLFQPAYLKGIGLAWMASSSLEQGLRRFVANSQLISTAAKLELFEQDDDLLIKYMPADDNNERTKGHKCAIELGLGFFLKMFRLAAERSIPASVVYVDFPIGDSEDKYQEYFQCPVHENAGFNGITFSKELLSELLPAHDSELVLLIESSIAKHLQSMDIIQTSQKVVRVLSKTMASGCISEESVAFELLMSKRTLQRKLQSEGNTFSELLNSLRISLAKQYLTSSLNSVTEITYQLGYSSPSIFSRAFKQNTRYTPMSFREKFKLAS